MRQIVFSQEEADVLSKGRLYHPHARVRQKMWLVSQRFSQAAIAQIVGVSLNTVRAYINEYSTGGIEALKTLPFARRRSELEHYQAQLIAHFAAYPPSSVRQAQAQIRHITGLQRGYTQVRMFLHRIGMQPRRVGAVPAKADPEKQEEFKKKSYNHVLNKPNKGSAKCTLWTLPTLSCQPF